MIVTSSLSLSLPPFSPLWHTVYYDSLYLSHTLSLSISLTHSLSLCHVCVCFIYSGEPLEERYPSPVLASEPLTFDPPSLDFRDQ